MRQINKTQRRLAAGAFMVVAAPIAVASVSYACGGMATLHANPLSAPAGSTVSLFGKGYSSNVANSPIEIRLNDRNGPVLMTIAPLAVPNGVLTSSLVIPTDTAVGEHTVIATQFSSTGTPISGTPGRATVKVTAAPLSSRVGAVTGDQAAVVAPGSSASSAAPTAAQVVAPTAATLTAAPSASVAAPSTPASPAATAPAVAESASASVASGSAAVSIPAADGTVAPAAAVAAATAAPAPATATFNGSGLVPVSSDAASNLPALVLAGGLALILLSLAAFFKSGRNLLGGRGFTPLA